jgi:uridine phosphorylase
MISKLVNTSARIPETELILREDGSVYHLGIRGEHLARKIIVVGDPERVPIISRRMDAIEHRVSGREFVIHTGRIGSNMLSVVSTGIGVDNIDIVINELDAAVNVDPSTRLPRQEHVALEIIRIGTSGTVQHDIAPGSFVASAAAFGLDGVPFSYYMEMEEAEVALMQTLKDHFPHLNSKEGLYAVWASNELMGRIAGGMIQGITATANGFYGPQGRSVRLRSRMTERIDSYASFAFRGHRLTNFEMECAGVYALSSLLGHKALTVCAILANRATKEFHTNPSVSMEALIDQVLGC